MQESLWHLARDGETSICLRHFYYKILKMNIKHIWWQIDTDLIFIMFKRPSWSNKYLSKYSLFPEDIDLDISWLTWVTQLKLSRAQTLSIWREAGGTICASSSLFPSVTRTAEQSVSWGAPVKYLKKGELGTSAYSRRCYSMACSGINFLLTRKNMLEEQFSN